VVNRARNSVKWAAWNGEKDVVTNTERVTECGGVARLSSSTRFCKRHVIDYINHKIYLVNA
jgi:hypothetical protein